MAQGDVGPGAAGPILYHQRGHSPALADVTRPQSEVVRETSRGEPEIVGTDDPSLFRQIRPKASVHPRGGEHDG